MPPCWFLLIEPQAQRCTYGTIARCFLAPGGFHPVEVAVKTFEEVIGEAQRRYSSLHVPYLASGTLSSDGCGWGQRASIVIQ